MDNRAQVTIEYLIMVSVGVIIATVIMLLVGNLLDIRDGIKHLIDVYRNKALQLE